MIANLLLYTGCSDGCRRQRTDFLPTVELLASRDLPFYRYLNMPPTPVDPYRMLQPLQSTTKWILLCDATPTPPRVHAFFSSICVASAVGPDSSSWLSSPALVDVAFLLLRHGQHPLFSADAAAICGNSSPGGKKASSRTGIRMQLLRSVDERNGRGVRVEMGRAYNPSSTMNDGSSCMTWFLRCVSRADQDFGRPCATASTYPQPPAISATR